MKAAYIDGLEIVIIQNSDIRGVEIGKEVHTLSLYAGDIIIYLTLPQKSMNHLMNVIKDFSLVSGYKLNENKFESLTIGAQIHSILKELYNFKWDTEELKYLGIYISKK